MSRQISSFGKEELNKIKPTRQRVSLLEVTHPDLAETARVVNNDRDVTHNGETYIALGFDIVWPDDMSQGQPRARLSISNVTKEFMGFLETSNGGQGAQARIVSTFLRKGVNSTDTTGVEEWAFTLDLSDITVSNLTVSAALGYEDILNRNGLPWVYNAETAQGAI
jgi:hypothetical protein